MKLAFFATENDKAVDDLIATVLAEMNESGPHEPEYRDLMEKLERLNALKAETQPKRLSRDSIFMGAVHLFGILLIAAAEKEHVLSQKAMTQLGRVMK